VQTHYRDRTAAGAALADRLAKYAGQPGLTVLGLVRGGVPVAAVVADRLGAPLDVLVVRKIGVPWAPEVAFGAIGPGGVVVLNPDISTRLTKEDMAAVRQRESDELARREQRYRAGRPPLHVAGHTVIVVDDGLATGATARAAVAVARQLGAARVVLAVPVGSADAVAVLRAAVDELVCPLVPSAFGAVSRFYDDFDQVSDATVVALLDSAGSPDAPADR
jgi:predicted phosphoribosyltransferase